MLGLVVALLTLVAFGREVLHRYEINQQIRELEAQVREQEARKAQLTDLIQYFSSPLFQEQEARQKLGKAKPGETVVIVPTSAGEPAAASPASTNAPSGTAADAVVSNPVRWWQYFFSS